MLWCLPLSEIKNEEWAGVAALACPCVSTSQAPWVVGRVGSRTLETGGGVEMPSRPVQFSACPPLQMPPRTPHSHPRNTGLSPFPKPLPWPLRRGRAPEWVGHSLRRETETASSHVCGLADAGDRET